MFKRAVNLPETCVCVHHQHRGCDVHTRGTTADHQCQRARLLSLTAAEDTHTHTNTRTHTHACAHAHTDRCAGWKAAEEETNEGNTRETKLTSLNKQTRRVLQREVMKRQSTSDQRRRGRAREQTSTGSHSAMFLGFNCPKRQRDPGESRISYTWRKQTKLYHNKSLLLSRAFNVRQHQQEEMQACISLHRLTSQTTKLEPECVKE